MSRILVVDDDHAVAKAYERSLSAQGHLVRVAADGPGALEAVEGEPPDLVLLDVQLPGMNGLDVLEKLRRERPDLPVVVITAHGNLDTAVRAIRQGARDYLTKPVELARLEITVARAIENARLSREVGELRSRLKGESPLLVGKGPAIQEIFKQVAAFADSEVNVLLEGESGSGKEQVARALHAHSRRRDGPFEPLSCAAFPETLLENELFGHEAGAFTGALKRKEGKVEAARSGTLFLDEVGEIPLPIQAKLLRVLEDRIFSRLGGNEKIAGDFRLISATNRNLTELKNSGRFREDLYFRLKVVTVRVPPLRERREDIPLLLAHFISRAGSENAVGEEALGILSGYDWPGNVRELKNAVEHALVVARGGPIRPEHLPAFVRDRPDSPGEIARRLSEAVDLILAREAPEGARYYEAIALFEKPLIERILQKTRGNQVQASKLLGLHRTTLRSKMREYGLLQPGDKEDEEPPPNDEFRRTNDERSPKSE